MALGGPGFPSSTISSLDHEDTDHYHNSFPVQRIPSVWCWLLGGGEFLLVFPL